VKQAVRDQVVDFVQYWSGRAEIAASRLVSWVGISGSKYYQWRQRYGQANGHNAAVPRGSWLTEAEQAAILAYQADHPQEGYRRLAYMMLDEGVVAVSPSSVYRLLKAANRLQKWAKTPSKKGTGFQQPLQPHQHWHIDISYLNICGTFYYLCTVLDGYSRLVVHWEIRPQMTEPDVEIILQRARERFPQARPRLISDNGPQFVAKEFKAFIRWCGWTHVRTSPAYPQSNGKLERWHRTIKADCIRPGTPLSLADARRLVAAFVAYYNNERLHSALGYITPKDKLAGREAEILADRQRKLEQARQDRQRYWQQQPENMVDEEGFLMTLPEQTTSLECLT
jgi:putative transposase